MSAPAIRDGEALALTRHLPTARDAYSLFAALSDGGQRRDMVLIERSVGPSLLLDRAALRIECRGQTVTLPRCRKVAATSFPPRDFVGRGTMRSMVEG